MILPFYGKLFFNMHEIIYLYIIYRKIGKIEENTEWIRIICNHTILTAAILNHFPLFFLFF